MHGFSVSQGKDSLLSLVMRLRDEDLKKFYPEYSELSADIMVAVTSLPKLLPKGAATKEATMKSIKAGKLPKNVTRSDWHIEKALKLAHSLVRSFSYLFYFFLYYFFNSLT